MHGQKSQYSNRWSGTSIDGRQENGPRYKQRSETLEQADEQEEKQNPETRQSQGR